MKTDKAIAKEHKTNDAKQFGKGVWVCGCQSCTMIRGMEAQKEKLEDAFDCQRQRSLPSVAEAFFKKWGEHYQPFLQRQRF